MRTPRRAVMASFILNGALFGAWASRIPAVADRHGLSHGDLGLFLLMMGFGAIVAFPITGRWVDRWGAARVTRIIALAYLTSLSLIGLAPTVWTLAPALFFFGATHGGMDVAMNAWAGEVEKHLGKPIMASFHALWSLGAGLAGGSGFLAIKAGFGYTPHFLLVSAAVAGLIWWMLIAWQSARSEVKPATPLFALPKGALLLVGLFAFCASIGEGGVADWGALMLIDTTGVTEDRAALGFAVFSVTMVVMRLLGDRITARYGAVKVARGAGVAALVGTVLTISGLGYAVALVGFAAMGVGYSMVFPLAYSRAAADPHIAPGAAIASVATLGYGGLLLGPPMLGAIAEMTSLRMSFALLACLSVMIVVLGRAVGPAKSSD